MSYLDWELSDFAEMNPKSPGQRVSPLSHLSRIGATNGAFLGLAVEALEENTPSIACFAQLPFPAVDIENKFKRPGATRLFELHFYPAAISIDDDGSQTLIGPIEESFSVRAIRMTQVIGIVKYWGVRAEWYTRFAEKVTSKGLQDGIIVPSEFSWLKVRQPITAALFENNLANRLVSDFHVAIRRALPTGIDRGYDDILNYFIMPYPGRLAFGGKPEPVLRYIDTVNLNTKMDISNGASQPKQSVFLSYGGPDESIAESLRFDLQKRGVDTWWFPSDAKWGARIHHEVSLNIRKYDRLLLLCSSRSLIRNGVLHELEEVFSREAEEGGKSILIPVALDNVLNDEWWRYEADQAGKPVVGKFSDEELSRRKDLANALNRRVVGDLKGARPGDIKWGMAVKRLVDILLL